VRDQERLLQRLSFAWLAWLTSVVFATPVGFCGSASAAGTKPFSLTSSARATSAANPGIELSSCALAGLSEPARCGTLSVAENPDKPAGRRLAIGVAVIPAIGGHAHPDPIVVLMGGPGEDAIGSAADSAARFAPLRRDRDILLVDQRGTGRSNALHCDLFSAEHPEVSLRDLFPVDAVARCARILGANADLTQYNYDRFADDLEQVRHALGYGQLNLFSGS
jgi:pimeloyl-ACP methyl ester carboxylesterase